MTIDLGRAVSRPRVKWALIILAWTLFGVLTAGELYFQARVQGREPALIRILAWYLAWTYTWALFTPLILYLKRRFPFNRDRWARSLSVHLPASLLISWIGSLAYTSAGQLLGRIPPGADVLIERSLTTFVAFLHFDPFLYWIVIGVSYLVQQYQESRARELQALQLETQLAEARLQALEMQLHPHFLFNALNTIAVLIRTQKNPQAVRVVTGLGELLRRVLASAGTQFVPLRQEVEFIERYLEIEQLRFGDRLKVELRIEPDTLEASVPHLILQPLVENAIQHAIAPRVALGVLHVGARRVGERLLLRVQDNGPGLREPSASRRGNGVGLSTTGERLQRIYGDDHRFEVANAAEGGVRAELDIPYRLAPDEWQRDA